jgi:hypothetical protein
MRYREIDRRHHGYGFFKYAVDFSYLELIKYCEMREWCWSQWGASSELDIWEKTQTRLSTNWCWLKEKGIVRIYLFSDKEYQWFLLKWC